MGGKQEENKDRQTKHILQGITIFRFILFNIYMGNTRLLHRIFIVSVPSSSVETEAPHGEQKFFIL